MGRPLTDPLSRILSHVEVGDCWEWTAGRDKDGYGKTNLRLGDRTVHVRAHRAVYELLVEPIPVGMVVDHLCRNRACCNPDHLEVVTTEENTRRGGNANRWKGICVRGHDLRKAKVRPDGRRRCLECAVQHARDGRARAGRPYVGRRRVVSNATAQVMTGADYDA